MNFKFNKFDFVNFQIKVNGVPVFTSPTGEVDEQIIGIAGVSGTYGDMTIDDCAALFAGEIASCPINSGDQITVCFRGYDKCNMYNHCPYEIVGDAFNCDAANGAGSSDCNSIDIEVCKGCTQHFYPITEATTEFEVTEIPEGYEFSKVTNVLINGVGQNASPDTAFTWTADGTAITVVHTPGEPNLPCYVDIQFQVCKTVSVATC